jgi:hypothetical protein
MSGFSMVIWLVMFKEHQQIVHYAWPLYLDAHVANTVFIFIYLRMIEIQEQDYYF